MLSNLRLAQLHDLAIFPIMGVLAGCGLIYEYLLSHYTGRVLGLMEHTIFTMIGIMIVSMGIGSFAARHLKHPFASFAWLEVGIALLGATSVLLIAAVFAFSHFLPRIIARVFDLPEDVVFIGGLFQDIKAVAKVVPFVIGFLLGVMIGMEIPLIARVREQIYGEHLEHNTGSIYGIDYIGAGIGAGLWVLFMLKMENTHAAVWTASANLVAGIMFFVLYRKRIQSWGFLLIAHTLVALLVVAIARYGPDWDAALEDMLFKDKVIFRLDTKFQHLTMTERHLGGDRPPVIAFYINGVPQFSSKDEQIYHSMLVYPAMAASARHENILIIGGGDGLALREVLRWVPKSVLVLDIDQDLVNFFRHPHKMNGKVINQRLLELNHYAFSDPRVQLRFGDAFNSVDDLIRENLNFDTIIVDLPDPNHPDLNKLYTARFYAKLKHLLNGDGAMAVQSSSPYHAKKVFLCIGKTVEYAGFAHVEQYHTNVPSFGEWGWTIATKVGKSAKKRLMDDEVFEVDDGWIQQEFVLASFQFNAHYFDDFNKININRIGSHEIYSYHQQDWRSN
jgi:spermidine synthase